MAGQVLGGNSPLSGGLGLNPLSGLTGQLPFGQMGQMVQNANPFAGLVQQFTQSLQNPRTNAMTAPPQIPQAAPNGPGSQGGWGAQPGSAPFVSQDERSSLPDRLGLNPQTAPVNQNGDPTPAAASGASSQQPTATVPTTDPYGIPPAVKAGIFKGEGTQGNYDTLLGHSERQGGPFEGTRVSQMTVDQAIKFSQPGGAYANFAMNKVGRVATPMGAYQVVGATLQKAKEGLGLTGNEVMTPQLQDRIGGWIYAHQGTSAWAGYKGPADPQQVFQPGESLHIPSKRTGAGGGARQKPDAMGPGFGPNITIPQDAYANSYGVAGDGQDNTATAAGPVAQNDAAARRARMQRIAAESPQGVGPALPGTRPPMQDQNNPGYQQVAAAQHTQHSRALPAVDVVKGLASIGKGYRDNAGSTYG